MSACQSYRGIGADVRAQGSRSVDPCYECGTDNLIGPICGGCNPEIVAMVDGGPGPGEAVADGWENRTRQLAAAYGADREMTDWYIKIVRAVLGGTSPSY